MLEGSLRTILTKADGRGVVARYLPDTGGQSLETPRILSVSTPKVINLGCYARSPIAVMWC